MSFSAAVTGPRAPQHVEPVFLRRRDLPPSLPGRGLDALDICTSAEKVSGRETIFGCQDIKGLWRLYPTTRHARQILLVEGFDVGGLHVTVLDKNPFILRDSGSEIPATKLFISDIPISCSDKDIESALARIGCVLRSSFILEKIRDRDGKLTRFVTGRRFAFINLPEKSLDHSLPVGSFTAKLFYKEQDKPFRRPVTCSRCLQTGHHVSVCQNLVTCRECRQSGHVQGDRACGALLWDLKDLHDFPPPSAELLQTDTDGSSDSEEVNIQGDGTDKDKPPKVDKVVEKCDDSSDTVTMEDNKDKDKTEDRTTPRKRTKTQAKRTGRTERTNNKQVAQTTLASSPRPRSNTPKRHRALVSPDHPKHTPEKNRRLTDSSTAGQIGSGTDPKHD